MQFAVFFLLLRCDLYSLAFTDLFIVNTAINLPFCFHFVSVWFYICLQLVNFKTVVLFPIYKYVSAIQQQLGLVNVAGNLLL